MQDLRMTLKTQILLLVTNLAQVGIVKNPKNFGSTTNLTLDKASAVYAPKLVGTGYS